jgi:hypothetical protein
VIDPAVLLIPAEFAGVAPELDAALRINRIGEAGMAGATDRVSSTPGEVHAGEAMSGTLPGDADGNGHVTGM